MTSPAHARHGLVSVSALLMLGCALGLGCSSDGGPSGRDPARDAGAAPPEAGLPDTLRTPASITWTYHGKEMRLYLPAPTGSPLPVTMYLHACQNVNVYAGEWLISALNDVEPCAVLLPTAPPAIDYTCADWGGTYDESERPNMVDAVAMLDQVIAEYGLDGARQYLYGESMGGEGVYRLLVDHPARFAAGTAVAGYTKDAGASQMAETPLWIFHGAADGTSPVENARAIYASIGEAGGTKVKYTEYPGLDHVPAIEKARHEPGLLGWLLAQRR